MRRLFLKMFLWFLLAMILVIATLLLSAAITQSNRPCAPRLGVRGPLRRSRPCLGWRSGNVGL